MSHRNLYCTALLAFGLIMFTAGCKKKAPEMDPTPPVETQDEAAVPIDEPIVVEVIDPNAFKDEIIEEELIDLTRDAMRSQLQTVFFSFDQYDLSSDGRRTLQQNYNLLRENESFNVIIEGHCDERGTIEYNLALGEKRAAGVRDYLVSLGLSPSRLRIVSYGEERPNDSSHGESAWAKNRRANFDLDR
jgi:peptidoglycan-associated lipoprotein